MTDDDLPYKIVKIGRKIPLDVTFTKSLQGDFFVTLAHTDAGKEALDELYPQLQWSGPDPRDSVDYLWYTQIAPLDESGTFDASSLDGLAAELLERDLRVGIWRQIGEGTQCSEYLLNDDGTASTYRPQ
jgi:hypothetical protein